MGRFGGHILLYPHHGIKSLKQLSCYWEKDKLFFFFFRNLVPNTTVSSSVDVNETYSEESSK